MYLRFYALFQLVFLKGPQFEALRWFRWLFVAMAIAPLCSCEFNNLLERTTELEQEIEPPPPMDPAVLPQEFSITTPNISGSTNVNFTWQLSDNVDSYDVVITRNSLNIATFSSLVTNNVSSTLTEAAYSVEVYAKNQFGTTPAINNGKLVVVDLGVPTVTILKRSVQKRYSNSLPLEYDIVFSEGIDLTSFDESDITALGTATGVTWNLINSGDDANFILQATAVAGGGSVTPTLLADALFDMAGNGNLAATGVDNTVHYTALPPVPENVALFGMSNTELLLKWGSGGKDTNGFKISFGTTDPVDCSTPQFTPAATATSQIVNSLTANMLYYFRICSTNALGMTSDSVLRSFRALPNCDVALPISLSTDKAKLVIAAARTPGGMADLTIEAAIAGVSGELIKFEILDGGASGVATAVRTGLGTAASYYLITVTAFDDSSSNTDIIAAIGADVDSNAIVTATGADATDGVDPVATRDYLYIGQNFGEFQSVLDLAETNRVAHLADDGLITICLGDHFTAINSELRNFTQLTIPGNNFYITSKLDDDAQIRGRRDMYAGSATDAELKQNLIRIDGKLDISFVNLVMDASHGRYANGLTATNGADISVLSNIQFVRRKSSNNGDHVFLKLSNGSHADLVTDITGWLYNWDGSGLYLNGASTIDTARNLHYWGTTSRSSAVYLSGGSSITNLENISVELGRAGSGTSLYGIRLRASHIDFLQDYRVVGRNYLRSLSLEDNSYIANMENVVMRKAASAVENSYSFITADPAGSNNYFVTAAVKTVRVCSDAATVNKWEDNGVGQLSNIIGGTITAAGSHAIYPGNFGVESFPFTDTSVLGDQGLPAHISLGGSCLTENISGLNVDSITTNSVSLSWTAGTGPITGYRVSYTDDLVSGLSLGCHGKDILYEGSFTGTSVVVTGLKSATDYKFRVCSINTGETPKGSSIGVSTSATTL